MLCCEGHTGNTVYGSKLRAQFIQFVVHHACHLVVARIGDQGIRKRQGNADRQSRSVRNLILARGIIQGDIHGEVFQVVKTAVFIHQSLHDCFRCLCILRDLDHKVIRGALDGCRHHSGVGKTVLVNDDHRSGIVLVAGGC